MHAVKTFTDFLLESERNYPKQTGSFTLLLVQLENAAKIIASHVRESGLIDILGKTGKINSFQEEVQKLDEFSNDLLISMLTNSGQTHTLVSEEVDKPLPVPKSHAGNYIVYFDPLDGSSNIDINAPIGTIFSIYHKKGGLLQKGEKQIAAGYIIYGPSTMLVYADQKEVNGFTLDPSIGSFLLSHPHMTIPTSHVVYSVNEAYNDLYSLPLQKYISFMKNKPKATLRYMAALVADIHRTLLKGGVFLYPASTKYPEGKLRLMIEVNPMSYIIQKAGGLAIAKQENPLNSIPKTIHQLSPFVVGSSQNVREYIQFTQGHD